MNGEVAMAQPNMKARIERVLSNPKMGTGIVKTAGWILLVLSAVPVLYSAAALQVTSEPVKPSAAAFAPEIGRKPLPQKTVASPQIAPNPAPATAPQVRQNSSSLAAELKDPFQTVLEYRDIQRRYEEMKQELAQAQAIQASLGQTPDLQQMNRISGSVAFLQDQLKRTEKQLSTLQIALQQQGQANPPSTDALLNLPGDKDDLLASLKQLSRLRNAPIRNLYLVLFTGIQGRTISMKVADQNFTFGCESCSFFVGESVVSSAASAPPGPGIIIRLSPDGNKLTVACQATLCNINFDGAYTGQQTMWQFASGDSETFEATKLRSVVVSKD